MAQLSSLRNAVQCAINDGCSVAIEGFSHLVPYAAAHEIIRQGRVGLTLIRMVPDVLADQMVGSGCVDRLVFSWAGNPGLGLLPRIRDAIENSWPKPLSIEEHTHAELANRFVAGASRVPFAVMRGRPAPDLAGYSPSVSVVACPFSGEFVTAVKAVNPDVAIIHAQMADPAGNVLINGVVGMQKEAILAAAKSIVTVEMIVEELPRSNRATVIPNSAIDHICVVPRGAEPSYAFGLYARDNHALASWKSQATDRDVFTEWKRELLQVARGGR